MTTREQWAAVAARRDRMFERIKAAGRPVTLYELLEPGERPGKPSYQLKSNDIRCLIDAGRVERCGLRLVDGKHRDAYRAVEVPS